MATLNIGGRQSKSIFGEEIRIGLSLRMDNFEKSEPISSSDVQMACEVAKWMIVVGLNGNKRAAKKVVKREDLRPLHFMDSF